MAGRSLGYILAPPAADTGAGVPAPRTTAARSDHPQIPARQNQVRAGRHSQARPVGYILAPTAADSGAGVPGTTIYGSKVRQELTVPVAAR